MRIKINKRMTWTFSTSSRNAYFKLDLKKKNLKRKSFQIISRVYTLDTIHTAYVVAALSVLLFLSDSW